MQRMIISILFLFLANMAVADCCGTTSNADKNKWQNSGKELVVINGKIFELNVKKFTSDADELAVTYTKFNEDNSIFIDSVIYSDGTTSILETDFFLRKGFLHQEGNLNASFWQKEYRDVRDCEKIRRCQMLNV